MIALNGLPAISVRLLTTWQGAWLADVDFDLDVTQVVPSGRVAITVGASTLSGTIDPDNSGRFATHVRARVVGGGNGWQQIVTAQHSHNDGGVQSIDPIAAVASLVGEVAVVASPTNLGNDFVRFGTGPAYQVLRGLDWYVDFNGITQVTSRASTPVTDDDVHVLSFDGLMQTAQIATDVLLVPGMVLTDSRFDSSTIRQVEQTFDANGARAVAWLSKSDASVFSVGGAIGTVARIAVGLPTLRAYRYRVVAQNGDGRLVLQAVSKSAGIPDQLPIKIWYGAPGVSGKPAPGTIVVLRFLEGDPGQPIVVAFDDTTPMEVDIAASATINVAAPEVGLGEDIGRTGVATLETLTPLTSALATLFGAMQSFFDSSQNSAITMADSGGFASPIKGAAATLVTLVVAPTNFSSTVEATP